MTKPTFTAAHDSRRGVLVPLHAASAGAPGSSARRIGRLSFVLVLLCIASAASLLPMAMEERSRLAAASIDSGEVVDDPMASQPAIEVTDIAGALEDWAWIATYGGIGDAAAHGKSCFEQLQSYPDVRLLDHCIAFDYASIGWPEGPDPKPTYFAEKTMKARHARALNLVFSSRTASEARLTALQNMAFRELTKPKGSETPEAGEADPRLRSVHAQLRANRGL